MKKLTILALFLGLIILMSGFVMAMPGHADFVKNTEGPGLSSEYLLESGGWMKIMSDDNGEIGYCSLREI